MAQPVIPRSRRGALANLGVSGQLAPTDLLHLYTNNLSPTEFTALTDLVEMTSAEMPGYASVPIGTITGPFIDQNDNVAFELAEGVFIATSAPPSPITSYGWYITDSGNTLLKMSEAFDTPQTVANLLDSVTADPDFACPPIVAGVFVP